MVEEANPQEMKTMEVEEDNAKKPCRWSWTASSPEVLCQVEKNILSFLATPYRGYFVDIGPGVKSGDRVKIWTISLNEESKEVPLVMLHGMGAGVALWILNLDDLAKDRPVYAIDILGFGRSSRPNFSKDALTAEKELAESVEKWRLKMNIDKMILLGHSMGGFISSSYALSHPEHLTHLILADPWGFLEKPTDSNGTRRIPFWARGIVIALSPFNPLFALRAAGPFGQRLLQRMRADIVRKFAAAVGEDSTLVPQYIHQCNAQTPSGESAFRAMMMSFGWARHPMNLRIKDVQDDVPITFIYGEKSWIDSSPGELIQAERSKSFVEIKTVPEAGHHVYADDPEVFNTFVNETCNAYKNAVKPTKFDGETVEIKSQ